MLRTSCKRDLRGLRKLAATAGERLVRGLVLDDGTARIRFDDHLEAVPLRSSWETA